MTEQAVESSPRLFSFSVSAWIADDAGRYLLLHRSTTSRHFAGQWEPPGGKVEGGESLVAALLREVKEETGLDVVVLDVAGVTRFDLSKVRVVVLGFTVAVTGGRFAVGREHNAFQWVARHEIAAMELTPAGRGLLEPWRP